MKGFKRERAATLSILKTSSDDIQIGDNIVVRRSVTGRDEICIATVVEIKTVEQQQYEQRQEERKREQQQHQNGILSESEKQGQSVDEPMAMENDEASTETGSAPAIADSDSEPSTSTNEENNKRQLYYVHYNGMDRRLDEWVDKSRIIEEEDTPTLTPIDPLISGKTLTRSQRRFHEEFHHLQKNFEDMDATTAKLEREHEERTKVKNVDLIQFGEYEIDAWYFSPFPLPVTINNSKIFFCEFCLWYTVDMNLYQCHCLHYCKEREPPGNEIYRDGNLAAFEVEGKLEKTYCQSLCLISKLFLDHKTLYYDVEGFLFYILCEVDEDGTHIVGHFSKEIASENNLACIMVLPPYQRKGYGKLLIQLSYCLSEREGLIGTPEKPLSDLGKVSYRSYWWWVLLAVLDARRVDENISVGDLSNISGIHVDDIIYTFNTLQLIKYWKGNKKLMVQINGDHVVRASRKIVFHCMKLQLFHPPKLILKFEKVKWQPKEHPSMK